MAQRAQNGISGNLLDILSDFLRDRKQRFVLNGQRSTWKKMSTQAFIKVPFWDHYFLSLYKGFIW